MEQLYSLMEPLYFPFILVVFVVMAVPAMWDLLTHRDR